MRPTGADVGARRVGPGAVSARLHPIAWCALLLILGCDTGPPAPALDLPPRPDDAPEGTEIAREIRNLDFDAREARIYAEVARGNVPSWLRRLQRVEMTREIDGRTHQVTFWVTPDYLSVGSDSDHFLVPLSPRTAQRIAALAGGSLPTPGMVDAVWTSARSRLTPIRFEPDELIRTVPYFERHNRLVQSQQRLRGVRPGRLVAGHKLDVVLSATRGAQPGEFALYGWHRRDGTPIQPLLPVSADDRPHFSVGIRLVHRSILVDGVEEDLADVLRRP